jgi:hypothetical protein
LTLLVNSVSHSKKAQLTGSRVPALTAFQLVVAAEAAASIYLLDPAAVPEAVLAAVALP